MQTSNKPSKLLLPFANGGAKNTIPTDSQIGIVAGAASLVDGFPPLTRTPLEAGGIPPSGLDFNGIFYEISAIVRWANAGGGYAYDSAFATDSNVNGYPKGARVLRSDGLGYWFNTTENNTTDPESGGSGWVPDFSVGATSITMTNANVTLTALQYGKKIIVISGLLTGNLNLIFPAIYSDWILVNNTTGSFLITAKTSGGTGVIVFRGIPQDVFCNGVNIYLTNNRKTQICFKDFGAVGDGANDDRLAIIQAITYADTYGTPIIPDRGTYNYSSPITITGIRGLTINGETQNIDSSSSKSVCLRYTGAGSTFGISFESCAGAKLSGIAFKYSSNSFTGNLVQTDNPSGLDFTNYDISGNVFQGDDITVVSASALLRLKKTISGGVKNNVFKYAKKGLSLVSYVNVCDINLNTFLGMTENNIYAYNAGTLEAITIKKNTFEPLQNGKASGFDFEVGLPVKGFVYSENWHGDVSSTGNSWLNISNSNGVEITSNVFGSAGGGVSDYAIVCGTNAGMNISSNTFFDKAINFLSSSDGVHVSSNLFSGVSNQIAGRGNVSTSSTWLSNSGIDPYGAVKCYMSSNLTVPDSTYTLIPFQAEIYDTGNLHSTSVNNTRITVPVGFGGIWKFSASVQLGTGAITAPYIIQIIKNNSAVVLSQSGALNATVGLQPNISGEDLAADGDYYELRVWQNSGVSMTVVGLGLYAVDTHLCAHRVITG